MKEEETVGFKFNKWELKGIPLRIEIGEKETSDKTATLVRRDDHKKITADVSDLTSVIDTLLKKIQRELFEKHRKFTELNTYQVNHYDEFKRIMNSKRGFIRAFWCENNICENKIKEETKASTRCLPLDSSKENGKCVYCGKSAKHRWLFAQAY